ncbi:MAG: WecB/TagA/CpsF family glycosyltransferase [Planctomycetota bacterium]|nr:WecB/TagA/CpsF family glycosyltransferase [Planctomycetota bacterium]
MTQLEAPRPPMKQSMPARPTPTDSLPIVHLKGCDLHNLSERETITHALDEHDAGRGGWIFTVNLDIMRRLERDPSFRELVSPVTLRVADGMPLVWASRILGNPLKERVAGSNMIISLSGLAAQRGKRVFLLGGDPGIAEKAADALRERHTGINIVGTHCPPFGFQDRPDDVEAIRSQLESTQPDVVFVALSCPKQEWLIRQMRETLPAAWWLGCGISFSFVCGEVKRAPRWVQVLGLEWVHRMIQEPRKLAKRYLVDGVPYAVALFWSAFTQRFSSRRTEAKA